MYLFDQPYSKLWKEDGVGGEVLIYFFFYHKTIIIVITKIIIIIFFIIHPNKRKEVMPLCIEHFQSRG